MAMLMQQYYGSGYQGEPDNWDGGKEISDHEPSQWQALQDERVQVVTFGAGCYWGVEKHFAKFFAIQFPDAILGTAVDFMNPDQNTLIFNPSYDDVCMGDTGYVEVCQLVFDRTKVSLEQLCKYFYSFHDPTTPNQ